MRRFLAGKVSIVEDGRMDGYYEEVEKYRNKRNYVPLVPALILWCASASLPEARTVCGRAARTGPCGGRRATGVPTATYMPRNLRIAHLSMLVG
jgi:hypothetical protein